MAARPVRRARAGRRPAARRVNPRRLVQFGGFALLVLTSGGLIAGGVAAWIEQRSHRYPPAVVQQLLAGCRAGGGTESYCTCTVERVQRAYTYGEFQRLRPEASRAVGRSFGRECVAESHDYGPGFTGTFMEDCGEAGIPAARCACMLESVQRRFTFAQYMALEAQLFVTGERPAALAEALAACDDGS